jgi:hypothetical protein
MKEAVVAQCEVQPKNSSGVTKEDYEKPQSRKSASQAIFESGTSSIKAKTMPPSQFVRYTFWVIWRNVVPATDIARQHDTAIVLKLRTVSSPKR